MGITWNAPPPGRGGEYIPIFRPRPGAKESLILLGPFVGVELHWLGDRSMPCRGDGCRHCLAQSPKRWRGYFPALRSVATAGRFVPTPVIFEITEGNTERFADRECRGLALEVTRRSDRSPIAIRWDEGAAWDKVRGNLPEAFDVQAVLMRVWGVKDEAVQEDERPKTISFEEARRKHA